MKKIFTKNYWVRKGFALLMLVMIGGSVKGQVTLAGWDFNGLTGAGKSSFMRLINGVIPHHTAGILNGEITVAGQSINQLKPGQLSGIIGIVGQNPLNGFVTDQVEDEIAFGLETNGRTESILMSMPPMASWEYMHNSSQFPQGQHTLDLLKKGVDWLALK